MHQRRPPAEDGLVAALADVEGHVSTTPRIGMPTFSNIFRPCARREGDVRDVVMRAVRHLLRERRGWMSPVPAASTTR
jgi:hypothetical protein